MKFLSLAALLVFTSSVCFGKTFIYISEGKDKRIAVYSLDETNGGLKRVGALDCNGAPGCLWAIADRSKLYASIRSASEFATLAVDSETGLLTHISSAPSAGSAAYIYPDKSGHWLLAAYYGEGLATVSKIVDGVVTGAPVQTFETGKKAHCIQTSPDNRFAFVPHPVDLNKVHQFKFDAETGKLTNNDPKKMDGAEGAGPRHIQFHPNGKWAYVVNEQAKSVTHCLYDAEKGTLSRKDTVSTLPDDWAEPKGSCADIEISADGKFVYASNRGHDSIAMFRVDQESGALTSLGQAPTAKTPRSFNLMPGEKFLVAAGQGSGELVVYERNAETGLLKELQRYSCGKGPAWVVGLKLD
ncbi:MAG: lactonase family protein [Verrucomicrobiales bacterium]|nr:lactonase family protein [Verrucomicrobiales bacterium]